MIGIRYQYRVCKSCGDLGIICFSADGLDIVLASQERSNPKEDQRLLANVLPYDDAVLANQRRKLEREIANSRTEIHHNAAFVKIQRLDHVGWPLPLVSLAFHSSQSIKSLNALIELAEQEKQQHCAHHEHCYANTIRSLGTVIGYGDHLRNRNRLTQFRRAPNSPWFLCGLDFAACGQRQPVQ